MIREFVPRIVDKLLQDNPMCAQLGIVPTMSSAVECIRQLDVKLVMLDRLAEFLARLGIEQFDNQNVSTKYIQYNDMSRQLKLSISKKMEQDLKLFDHVMRSGVTGGYPWVRLQ